LWAVPDGQPRDVLHESDADLQAVRFSPDGKTLLTLTQTRTETIRCWEPRTGRLLLTLSTGNRKLFSATWLIFSTDGRTLGTFDPYTQAPRIWSTGNGDLAGPGGKP
jgi:WD40 repeat protein